ncbi:uncharacterized protein LOC113862354 [Abrus precatorius]|uniref:Uncharacterized protein LOC113862354 n=1 Tax=Abrus precatorius TaxID=3816 RepID=A0A8B8L4M6_ABRPR|nr:uncharacterized protein LOC113862354 [Abrus precatorius]
MEIPENRRWMETRLDHNRHLRHEFVKGVNEFIEFATTQQSFQKYQQLRCPCKKCQCRRFHYVDDVMVHLYEQGFMKNYYYWTNHGERMLPTPPTLVEESYYGMNNQREEFNPYEQMIMDHVGPEVGQVMEQQPVLREQNFEEDPNSDAQKFYDMLASAQAPLWDGCHTHSKLLASLVTLSLKFDYNMSEGCFNRMVQFMGEAMPNGNLMASNLYRAKKSVANLGLSCIKIDCCQDGCMLFCNTDEDDNVTTCKYCHKDRYKITCRRGIKKKVPIKRIWYFPITPRLQRLYSSMATSSHMRWHRENHRDPCVLCHLADGEAWKHFDIMYPKFAEDPRNVRLGLCADRFNPFGQYGKAYSCWPIILTPYNLPPGMCMKREFMFLTILIPGPTNPKSKIDVYMQPLIEELTSLWNNGILTYDISLRQNFNMKAALM